MSSIDDKSITTNSRVLSGPIGIFGQYLVLNSQFRPMLNLYYCILPPRYGLKIIVVPSEITSSLLMRYLRRDRGIYGLKYLGGYSYKYKYLGVLVRGSYFGGGF